MSLTFETIRLPNGQTYRFAGVLESVRTLNGDAIKVDNEGSAQGANQTTQTIQRAGVATLSEPSSAPSPAVEKEQRSAESLAPQAERLGFYSGQRQPRASDRHGTHDSVEWAKVKISEVHLRNPENQL
jgi:hypothetical protein